MRSGTYQIVISSSRVGNRGICKSSYSDAEILFFPNQSLVESKKIRPTGYNQNGRRSNGMYLECEET